MGLKLTVGKEDHITTSNGIVIKVLRVSGGNVQLEFHAARDIKINAEFKDRSKMFKNWQKEVNGNK